MERRLVNSSSISKLMHMPLINEPQSISDEGVLIGYSYTYSMPIHLNFESLVNPHIFIFGMTGSGKTYLMRSLVLKLSLIMDYSIVLVDFTGEYKEFAAHAGGLVGNLNLVETALKKNNALVYFNFRNLKEGEKIEQTEQILSVITNVMRKYRLNNGKRAFLILDEAWKMFKESNSLEILIREGRKYGVGLILASQLFEDADPKITSNIATTFVFRMQDKNSVNRLVRNYNISELIATGIQELDVGSCFLIRLYKSNKREAFRVKRVLGIELKKTIKIIVDKMEVEISLSKFESIVKELCPENAQNVIAKISESGIVTLDSLIADLLISGANRHMVLRAVRELGLSDSDIAEAFSIALGEMLSSV